MAKKRTPKPPPAPKKPHGAQIGNRNAEVLRTPEARAEAYRLYCLHIAAGYAGSSFYDPVIEDIMQDTMKRYPDELDAGELSKARAKGRLVWEQIGFQGTIGKLKGFNAHSWKFNMQNRLGWKDRTETGLDKETRTIFTVRMGKDIGGKDEDE